MFFILRALVPHVPHALRDVYAVHAVMSHVLSRMTCCLCLLPCVLYFPISPFALLCLHTSCSFLKFIFYMSVYLGNSLQQNENLYVGNTLKQRSALTNIIIRLNCFQRNDINPNSQCFRTHLANFATKTIVFSIITFEQILL